MQFNFSDLKADFSASIVVFFVALPLCLGIALASGAPLFSGIIAGIIGGIVVGFLSKSHISVTGPAAGLTAIVLTAITDLEAYEGEKCSSLSAIFISKESHWNSLLYSPLLKGMLVKFTDTLFITEMYNLARFNEVKLVQGSRPYTYTQKNAPSAAGYDAHIKELGARRITYDDGLSRQNQLICNLDGFW